MKPFSVLTGRRLSTYLLQHCKVNFGRLPRSGRIRYVWWPPRPRSPRVPGDFPVVARSRWPRVPGGSPVATRSPPSPVVFRWPRVPGRHASTRPRWFPGGHPSPVDSRWSPVPRWPPVPDGHASPGVTRLRGLPDGHPSPGRHASPTATLCL